MDVQTVEPGAAAPSAAPTAKLPSRDDVRQLRLLLADSGYMTFYRAFGEGNLNVAGWQDQMPRLGSDLADLVRLFLLQGDLPSARVSALLGERLLASLSDAGILRRHDGTVRTDELILICLNGLWFFCEHSMDPAIYFGNDSIALANYQTPVLGGRGLDVCSGGGIQAMIAARAGMEVRAVEIHPRASWIAEVNVAFNGLGDRVHVVRSSFEDVAAEHSGPFDRITFNPPLLPIPESVRYPFVGDGGPDGLQVSRKILETFLPTLAPDGAVEFIGLGQGHDGQPLFVRFLEPLLEEHGMDAHVHLTGCSALARGAPLFDGTVLTAAVCSHLPLPVVYAAFELDNARVGANQWMTFFMRVRPATGQRRRVRVTDLSAFNMAWFRPRMPV